MRLGSRAFDYMNRKLYPESTDFWLSDESELDRDLWRVVVEVRTEYGRQNMSHVDFESRHAIRDLVACDEFRRYTIKDTVQTQLRTSYRSPLPKIDCSDPLLEKVDVRIKN